MIEPFFVGAVIGALIFGALVRDEFAVGYACGVIFCAVSTWVIV
jgi:hypothetical protein